MQFKKGHVHKFITENREKIGKYLCTQYRDTMHDLKKKKMDITASILWKHRL